MTPRFPERLRHHRTKLGISQQALADHIGVSRVSINRWENGHVNPTANGVIKLADYFGLPIDTLIKDPE